jgi:hypothetical protein
MVHGSSFMVHGSWFLVSGFWFLVSGFWLLNQVVQDIIKFKPDVTKFCVQSKKTFNQKPRTRNQKLWFYPFLCLPDEGHQRRHFVGGRGALQFVELGFGQAVPEIAHHVESLPPAVQYLEARPLVIAAGAAVAERHRPTQPGAAPLQVVPVRHRATF